ncbi:MAG: sterol desaturase family protein, partial [Kiloniellales bacterium]
MDLVAESLLAWKIVAVLVWFGAFFAAERLLPAAPRPAPLDEPGRGGGGLRLARNLGLWLVNAAISPLIVVPVSLLASEAALAWRPEAWQGWPALLVDIVVLDFLIYWGHLANHRVPFLWRFHEVHHLDRFLDATTAVRFHFGEVLLSALARAAVIFLLGFPILSILVFETLLLMAAV